MNSLFDRLGDILKDYIEDDQDIFSKPSEEEESEKAPESAQTEVEDSDAEPDTADNNKTDANNTSQTKRKTFTFNTQNQQRTSFSHKTDSDYTIYKAPKPVPPQIRKDFDFFGLPLNASLDDCKAVYKKLLKVYHPDKHSSDPAKLKTATEYSARVNTAYKRIIEWLSADSTNKL